MATSYWTSTYYEFLTDEQAELFRLLDRAIRDLGRSSSQADDYIAYKKEPEMKGAFVRISQGKKPSLNVHLALITFEEIDDPHNLCEKDYKFGRSWSRTSLVVNCTPESDIKYIMDLVHQAFQTAMVHDRKRAP